MQILRAYVEAFIETPHLAPNTQEQSHLARISIAIIDLVGIIFPSYKDNCEPLRESLVIHRSLCNSVKLIPAIHQIIIAPRKMKISLIVKLFDAIGLSLKFLEDSGLVNWKALLQLVQNIGFVPVSNVSTVSSNHSYKFIFKFALANVKNISMAIGSTVSIGIFIVNYCQSKTPPEKKEALAPEKILFLVNQIGFLCITTLKMAQAPAILTVCLELGVYGIGYARFLLFNK